MRAIVLTANSLRHSYFVRVLSQNFELCGVIRQPKRKYYSEKIYGSEIVEKHFLRLSDTEKKFFSYLDDFNAIENNIDHFYLDEQNINDDECVSWARSKKPDVVFLFGTGILKNPWLDAFPNIINLHLGLSPFYRGSATLFWPFVEQRIECVGTTIHLAVSDVDAGPILQRVKPVLHPGDDYYSINYKAIKAGIDSVPDIARRYLKGDIIPLEQAGLEAGKIFFKKDFSEESLVKALSFVGDGITQKKIDKANSSLICNF